MNPHESPATRLIHSLNRRIDELIVQLSLGKAEAADQVEATKQSLSEKLDNVRAALTPGGSSDAFAAKLDHLRVQLALGKMESRDAYEAQREKIHQALEETRSGFHHLEDRVREDLEDLAATLELKLNALALDLGIAAIIAEDELKTKKEEFVARASRLAGKLKSSASAVGHEAETAAREARLAYEDIRDNLQGLFHRD
jgi:formiminotetrahydrofolate cyclodeaminase